MPSADAKRVDRRARARSVARAGIMAAARRLADREGARNLSLRGVAEEAGFTPAALYVYFRNRDELLLALAADDLSKIAQAMRLATGATSAQERLSNAARSALDLLIRSETLAAASNAFTPEARGTEVERAFNGRLIVTLTALQAATGADLRSRTSQMDAVLLGATLAGFALFVRSGRLEALGFSVEELLARLTGSFSPSHNA